MLIYLFTCACISQAQVNYVLNPSLEEHKYCPAELDQIRVAKFWSAVDTVNIMVSSGGDTVSQGNCSPEYIHTCAVGTSAVAPDNGYFYQYPRTGQGMALVVMFVDNTSPIPFKRDYLVGRLRSALTAGKPYCVSFYVSFGGTGTGVASGYAVDHIGAYLDNGRVCKDTGENYCGLPHPEYMPQVYSTSIITDSLGWTKIQGNFVANGTERFITIGNFFDNVNVNVIDYTATVSSFFSWYVVDDISVIENSAAANAGPDKMIGVGDSVWVGTNEEGMPCTWYVSGSSTPIGYSGGMWVKPTATTTYVVEMDLCGSVTRDSAKVLVFPTGLSTALKVTAPMVWPNPASNELNIEHAPGCDVQLYDALGRLVHSAHITSENEQLQIGALLAGIYTLHIVDAVTGYKQVRKVVKE